MKRQWWLVGLGLWGGCGGTPNEKPATTDVHSGTTHSGETTEDSGEPSPPDPRVEAVLAAAQAELDANLATGAQIAIWTGDEIVYVGGVGSASAWEDQPIAEDTVFMIGSDTKKMAAISLLRLVETGVVSLEDTLATHIPAYSPRDADAFTGASVHALLSHQGAIADWIHWSVETTDDQLAEVALSDFSTNAYSMASPGLFWNYSNPNFSVAGWVEETVSGEAWPDRVWNGLVQPLGMDRTFVRKADITGAASTGMGLRSPRDATFGPVAWEDHWEDAFVRPAGLVWSTASDQMRLAQFLVDGDSAVLSDSARALVSTPHVVCYPDYTTYYGYGLFIDRGVSLSSGYYDIPVWSHGGNTLTHTSTFFILPEQRFAISILSNGYGDDFSQTVAAAVEAWADLPPPGPEPASPAIDGDEAATFAGTYFDPYSVGTLQLSMGEAGFQVVFPDLDDAGIGYSSILEPVSTHNWVVNIDGGSYLLSLIRAADGMDYVVNRAFVARETPPAAAPPRTPRSAAQVRAALTSALRASEPFAHPLHPLSKRLR